MSTGKEEPVLVRGPVDSEFHEVCADAAVIQQSVALARSAIAGHALPGTLATDEELEEVVADGSHLCRKAVMALDCVEARRSLSSENAGNGRAHLLTRCAWSRHGSEVPRYRPL